MKKKNQSIKKVVNKLGEQGVIVVPAGVKVRNQTKMDSLIQEVETYSLLLKSAKEDVKNHVNFLKEEMEKAK